MSSDRLERAERHLADGDAAQAYRLAGDVLSGEPDNPRALLLAGRIERLGGRLDDASARLERAAELAPELAAVHLELATIYRRTRDFERCMDELTLAMHYDPGGVEAHVEMGSVLRQQNDLEGAEAALREAVARAPTDAKALSELGWLLVNAKRHAEALGFLEQAVELNPRDIPGQNNLGYAYVKLEMYERALEVFSRLCERSPAFLLGPRINLGNAFDHNGELEKAERAYESVLRFEPNNFTARWNRAHLLLGRKAFEQGWTDYEYRLQEEGVWQPRLIPFAPWKGEPLEGKTLLLSAEQGLGDQIMFASCVGEVAARAKRLIVECERRLESLFRRSFPGVEIIGSEHELVPPWLRGIGAVDYHLPAGSLPGFFRRQLSSFPAHAGYLQADAASVARWRATLDAIGPGFKVGISWRGGTPVTRHSLRTIDVEELAPILGTPGCTFVSLQYGVGVAEDLARLKQTTGIDVHHWQEAIDDYDQTAALCGALDMTVSVCTAVIHLNGALGRPVWIMVPSAAEWRYGASGEGMPWYPSARLFRQPARGQWAPVIGAVAAALRTQAASGRNSVAQ